MPSARPDNRFYIVPESLDDERLDVCVSALDKSISRARVQRYIKDGLAKLDGVVCSSAKTLVRRGMRIDLEIPPPEEPEFAEAEDIPLEVLFEDALMIVIDKPAGMVVHPAAGNWTGTVVNALLGREPELAEDFEDERMRPGIVHRLDKDTSGCLVVAKSADAMTRLSRKFAEHEISKTYMAIVAGWPKPEQGQLKTLIGRHPVDRKRMAVLTTRGREAITIYKTLRKGEIDAVRAALMEVKILTGRTHQIRVHMAHLGHPVAGDSVYGGAKRIPAPRQMLHAWKLEFLHPFTGRKMKFKAPFPEDFKSLMDQLPGQEEEN